MVVGGGIIGTSIAYHLAHMKQEVVVLEQSQLTSGTTWHAAGSYSIFYNSYLHSFPCVDVHLCTFCQIQAVVIYSKPCMPGLMVTFGSLSETSTEIRKYSRDLYSRLEQETGLATGFNPVGA